MDSIKREERNHETWLQGYTGNSLKQYTRTWQLFEEYLRERPPRQDEQWVLDNPNEDWGTHLVDFHRWLKNHSKHRGEGTLSDNTARVHANGIRGYLQHVGIGLGLSRIQKLEIVKVESMPMKDYPFDLKTKEKILAIADPIEEYIVSVGISFGLRIGDFLLMTRGTLEPLLDKEVPIQMPKIITQKEGFPAYPFIDGDAKYAIKRLLKQMDMEGRTGKSEKLLNLTPKTVNNKLKALFERAGLPLGDYRIRFHCLRKFISDCLASVCSSDKWKWFVGKSTKSPYVSSEGRESYKLVLRLTQVNGSAKAKSSREDVESLRNTVSELKTLLIESPSTQSLFEDLNIRIDYLKTQLNHVESMIIVAMESRRIEPQVTEKYDKLIEELEGSRAPLQAMLDRLESLAERLRKQGIKI